MVVIVLNMLQMATDWWEPQLHELDGTPNAAYMPDLKAAQRIINLVFLGIYIVEMTLKWIGLGWPQYFGNPCAREGRITPETSAAPSDLSSVREPPLAWAGGTASTASSSPCPPSRRS